MSLEKLRKQINETDKKLVEVLNRRARIILRIGTIKERTGKSVYCADRESKILKGITAANKGPLKSEALKAIYREIMSASRALEKPLTIAFLGPQATFTHQASLKKFGSQVDYLSCENISDVFNEVEKDAADYGVVPIENSIEGAVNYTLDMFMDSDLKICSQMSLDIAHNLLANCSLERIRKVYSVPQVFGQCRIWLQENLTHAELIEVSSTTKAAQVAAHEKNSASISSILAAQIYGLKTACRNIEDSPHNITRFFVIGKEQSGITGQDKTSLMFSIKDKIGALHEMLEPFRKHKVNLNKIESRPSKKKAWDYYFFVDLEGHILEPRIKKAVEELENKCKFLKVLGSYPVGD
ncbi:MAG: prephenate dehydratase [Candidatus Omnitrophica bacterium]|nr:prephenate dehydratase [Candidatus Omnitrophota bacterium]